jgi:hypothetical protein
MIFQSNPFVEELVKVVQVWFIVAKLELHCEVVPQSMAAPTYIVSNADWHIDICLKVKM